MDRSSMRSFSRLALVLASVVLGNLLASRSVLHPVQVQLSRDSVVREERPAVRKWAVAYLLAAVNPKKAHTYLGFLYTILNTARVMRMDQTETDLVVMVQMSHHTDATELPRVHAGLLKRMGVKIKYLPKPSVPETFFSVVMTKFYILSLVEYSRVLFLDSDVMLFCSLDYIFEMSQPRDPGGAPVLRENLIHSSTTEAANAGFFIMAPGPGRYERARKIMREQSERVLEGGKFDEAIGWGHQFVPPHDYWSPSNSSERFYAWNWYGVEADQGIMYYWTKYIMRDVTILEEDRPYVENWVADDSSNSTIRLDAELHRPFAGLGCKSRVIDDDRIRLEYPWRNFHHFVGAHKPWIRSSRREFQNASIPVRAADVHTPIGAWLFVLDKVSQELGLGLDVPNLDLSLSAVGRTLTDEDMVGAAKQNAAP